MELLSSLSTTQQCVAAAGVAYAAYRVWTSLSSLRDDRHTILSSPKRRALLASASAPSPSNCGVFERGYFENASGLWIYTRSWRARDEKAVVFLLHGLGEHCGRYEHVAERLNRKGITVHAMDHQGHGQSEGDRAHVRRFEDLVDDADAFVRRTMGDYGFDRRRPRFLLGHSMGGLVAVLLAQRAIDRGEDGLWSGGVVLSGPALMVDPTKATPTLVRLAKLMSSIAPKLEVGDAIPPCDVTRDPHGQYRYATDPLVFHGRLRARLGAELLDAIGRACDAAGRFTWPLLLMQGGKDRLVVPAGGEHFVSEAASEDKLYRVYPELVHEIFNEPEFESVVDGMLGWMTERM